MKRNISQYLTIFMVIIIISATNLTASASFEPTTPILSQAAYLVNLDTNSVIYKKDETKKMYPASLTKIMTAILVLEKVTDLDAKVTAPGYIYDEFVEYGGVSTADIRKGEVVSVRDLLYGLLLPSACEAASILADYVGQGSVPDFVKMMNDRAKELGAQNTNFTNAHGLYQESQYTTAYDMSIIMKHAISLPLFTEISSSPSHKFQPTNKHTQAWAVYHTNKMIMKSSASYYPYITASKTGFTDQSGRNLASLAVKDGTRYMLVTLGGPLKDEKGKDFKELSSFMDAKNLYNWIFDSFVMQKLASIEETLASTKVELASKKDVVNLCPEKDVSALLPKSIDMKTVVSEPKVPDSVRAPVKKGDVIGILNFKIEDELIATTNLVAGEDINRNPFLYAMDCISTFFKSIGFKIGLLVVLILIALYLILVIRAIQKKKSRRGGFYSKGRRRRF